MCFNFKNGQGNQCVTNVFPSGCQYNFASASKMAAGVCALNFLLISSVPAGFMHGVITEGFKQKHDVLDVK